VWRGTARNSGRRGYPTTLSHTLAQALCCWRLFSIRTFPTRTTDAHYRSRYGTTRRKADGVCERRRQARELQAILDRVGMETPGGGVQEMLANDTLPVDQMRTSPQIPFPPAANGEQRWNLFSSSRARSIMRVCSLRSLVFFIGRLARQPGWCMPVCAA